MQQYISGLWALYSVTTAALVIQALFCHVLMLHASLAQIASRVLPNPNPCVPCTPDHAPALAAAQLTI